MACFDVHTFYTKAFIVQWKSLGFATTRYRAQIPCYVTPTNVDPNMTLRGNSFLGIAAITYISYHN